MRRARAARLTTCRVPRRNIYRARTVIRAEPQPRGEVCLGFPPAHVQSYFTQEGLAHHHIDTVNACQVDTRDALEFATQIKLGSVSCGWLFLFRLSLR